MLERLAYTFADESTQQAQMHAGAIIRCIEQHRILSLPPREPAQMTPRNVAAPLAVAATAGSVQPEAAADAPPGSMVFLTGTGRVLAESDGANRPRQRLHAPMKRERRRSSVGGERNRPKVQV